MYVSTLLLDIEPEYITKVVLVYEDDNDKLIKRFKDKVESSFRLDSGNPQFLFSRLRSEIDAMDSIANKKFDGYLLIPNDILTSGIVRYFSHSLSNIKLYNQLRRS